RAGLSRLQQPVRAERLQPSLRHEPARARGDGEARLDRRRRRVLRLRHLARNRGQSPGSVSGVRVGSLTPTTKSPPSGNKHNVGRADNRGDVMTGAIEESKPTARTTEVRRPLRAARDTWGIALVLPLAVSFAAHALDLDAGFGAAGRGYVPVSAAEAQTDTAVALVRQVDDKLVVLGTRTTNGHGVLLLQRYSSDGTFDAFYGQFGTATIDVPGVSLTAKQLFLEPDGTVRAVADTTAGLRVYAVTASGQVDNTFGPGGEALIPYASGVAQGTTSVHALDDGKLLAI